MFSSVGAFHSHGGGSVLQKCEFGACMLGDYFFILFQANFTNLGRLGEFWDLLDPFYPLLLKIGFLSEEKCFSKIIKDRMGDFHTFGEEVWSSPRTHTRGGASDPKIHENNVSAW